jgi:group I intron endonuclease
MYISRALLKYGYANFSLEILEYCNNKSEVVLREQYYIDLLKPEYNILPTAGSLLGFKHSEETIAKLSSLGKAKIWTPEHKAKRLEHLKRLNSSHKGRARPEGAGVPSIGIEVFDIENNETTVYPSIRDAARSIGCCDTTVGRALKIKMEKGVRLIKKRYTVSLQSEN